MYVYISWKHLKDHQLSESVGLFVCANETDDDSDGISCRAGTIRVINCACDTMLID